MMRMQRILLVIFMVINQSVFAADKKPLIAHPIVEKEIRRQLKKSTGKLDKADLDRVNRLSFNYKGFTDVGLKEVVKCKNLTYLGLGAAKITGATLKEAKCKKLVRLRLARTKITDAGLKELAKLKLENLTTLELSSCSQITDAGLKELAKLENLEVLELNRKNDKITVTGLKELAKCKKLIKLWLISAKITDVEFTELKKALPNCEIVK